MKLDVLTLNEQPYEETGVRQRIMPEAQRVSYTIGYISDLHLPNHISPAASKKDIEDFLDSVANEIVRVPIVVICGDISSDFELFKLFLKAIKKAIADYPHPIYSERHIFMVLGNHELYAAKSESYSDAVKRYKKLTDGSCVHVLNNDLWYYKSSSGFMTWKNISNRQLLSADASKIQEDLYGSEIILFGGTGFSQYNPNFNACHKAYGVQFSRETEIKEGKAFEKAYEQITSLLPNYRIVIATHMPIIDWMKEPHPHPNYIYLNGHTHKNSCFFDDRIRVYANNQVGYYSTDFELEKIVLSEPFDIFADYNDGIYTISAADYKAFHYTRGKPINYKSQNNVYLVKRAGFYCFFTTSSNGGLLLLNGGRKEKVTHDIQYYYDNMLDVINQIKIPLNDYTAYLKQISKAIKKIGGTGHIHGSIVDIDFFNHIFVNPNDGKTTPYYADNVIDKVVYPSVGSLLQERCPSLYEKYLVTKMRTPVLAPLDQKKPVTNSPFEYKETDMYWISHLFFKMEKLYDNILAVWPEEIKPPKRDKAEKRILAEHTDTVKERYVIDCGTVLSDSGDRVVVSYNDMPFPTEKTVYTSSKGRYIEYNGKRCYLKKQE